MATERVRVAVVGVGHLGKHHARLLRDIDCAELVAVADPRPEALAEARDRYRVDALSDYRDLAGRVDAVCVAVPTVRHLEIARFFLEAGVDVLVEKPIAPTAAEGREMVELAERHGRILQVGHVERFNPALQAIQQLGLVPRYIESHRLSGMTFRSMDIGVVLDLMIHDLDLVLSVVDAPIESVEAFGGALFTKNEDIASGILKFENGAVAHLTANRVALKPMRRMRFFCSDAYVSLDFNDAEAVVIRKQGDWDVGALDMAAIDLSKIENLTKFVFDGLLSVQRYKLDEGNPLRAEIESFVDCVRTRTRPLVGGAEGVAAVALAERILERIAKHAW